ncbi:DUF4269 domain-containing protein [Acidisphaera sp. S103]|uniref:DUF4269 domain-containing protein n=1 Tax=Acidisphaera sp. S103 TaxID=1747223 RepID=UPI00131BB6B9|nr:DUF4269 domain-containing protein [Acidisphaera sp. S103]
MTINARGPETPGTWPDRRSYEEALAERGVLEVLAPFDPRIAGTPPLGLDLPGSDVDVLCFAPDAHRFTDTVWHNFSTAPAFMAKQLVRAPRPVVASFEVAGWRHFAIEQRLLALGGDDLPVAVLALRGRGMKTEPAFAAALGLRGDPYLVLLDLGEQHDETLVLVLQAGGFTTPGQPLYDLTA